MKRPTRWKAEVVDEDDNVVWEVLAHNLPSPQVRSVLRDFGLRIRRASEPRPGPGAYNFSVYDPVNSIRAAREHAARRETQKGKLLMLLLDRNGEWVSRDEVRAVAGDSGDRRFRELRDLNWPIEIQQLHGGEAWHIRLDLNGAAP